LKECNSESRNTFKVNNFAECTKCSLLLLLLCGPSRSLLWNPGPGRLGKNWPISSSRPMPTLGFTGPLLAASRQDAIGCPWRHSGGAEVHPPKYEDGSNSCRKKKKWLWIHFLYQLLFKLLPDFRQFFCWGRSWVLRSWGSSAHLFTSTLFISTQHHFAPSCLLQYHHHTLIIN
jgi:hypothetical protein